MVVIYLVILKCHSLNFTFFHLLFITDNLSTLEIILIIVACIFLLLAVGGLLLCFCLVTRHRYEAGRHYSTQSWRKSGIPRINYGLSEYNDDIYYHDGGYEMSNFGDEEIRMKRLKNVMSHSPYLQQVILQ